MASKVLRNPLPKMALYGYDISTTSKVMYYVQAFDNVLKDTGNDIDPPSSIFLPSKP
jgi:hypothetical protein